MARPIKHNADYFPHDKDMRNDPRIKALRKKFVLGYSIYCMMIEYMTDTDHFKIELSDLNIELMSGDFDIDTAELRQVIEYCLILDLFQLDGKKISCKTLEKKLEPLLLKRKYNKERVIVTETPNTEGFRDNNTHSKVKESKVKKSKGEKIVNGAVAPTLTTEDKKGKLYSDLAPFVKTYGKVMIRAFYDYWTETNTAGNKMRFEAEKFFDISKRLATWNRNERMMQRVKEKPDPPPDPYAEAKHNRTLWTKEAWEERYKEQIEQDKGFRKAFGYDKLRKGSAVGIDVKS